MTVRSPVLDEVDEYDDRKHSFEASIEAFISHIQNRNPAYSTTYGEMSSNKQLLEIRGYGDSLAEAGIVMQDLLQVHDFLNITSHEEPRPMSYTLVPIDMLPMFLPLNIHEDHVVTQPSIDGLKTFVRCFNQFQILRQELDDCQSYAVQNSVYLGEKYLHDVEDCIELVQNTELTLRADFAEILQRVRGGLADASKLWQLLDDPKLENCWSKVITLLPSGPQDQAEFVKSMTVQGAAYIGYSGTDLPAELLRHQTGDSFIFYFSRAARSNEHSWVGNQELLTELLAKQGPKRIMLVDCDAIGKHLEKSHIVHVRNQQEVTKDLFEQRHFIADKCLARRFKKSLDVSLVQKPVKRRRVRLPCPGPDCDYGTMCDWICSDCNAPLGYGFTDDYIYCDCGRSLYTSYIFKCNGPRHGKGFTGYKKAAILPILRSLTSSENLNILILGESGVGKSTFINAFVDYLAFHSLNDAMNADKLEWVIPCSFSTQVMDRSNPESAIQQIEVKVGSRSDEHDGSKGQSATQQTAVYPVNIGNSTIRLIDTPGVGDTRGVEYDRKNMSDILSTLSSYDELHGIIILLKSNNSRLSVTFRFCVKELLTHLHRDATQNVVFGFTNTRISNYTPGDTFKPLTALLAEHPDVGLNLTTHTTYCFDSESFRFLAAHKSGTTMENLEDFRRSWQHSKDESWRLIEHFKSRKPHLVKHMISLNSTRELISQLTKPMAEISQIIRTNIELNKDQVADWNNTRLTGTRLRSRLRLQKIQLKVMDLDEPRTVCCNPSCTETRADSNGEDKQVTVYRTHCHEVCYLTDVKSDQMAHPALIGCTAFGGSDACNHCSHHWSEHMHVLYELDEEFITVEDPEVEKQVRANADDVTLRETAINSLKFQIQEYREEQALIRKAAVQFGWFLRKNSITPYNDALLAYLDHLIKEEEAKVQAGGNRKRLDALQEDRIKHEEEIQILKDNLLRDPDDPSCRPLTQQDVNHKVQELYHLKHVGKNLEGVIKSISAAHEATYREMPHREARHQGGFSVGGQTGCGQNMAPITTHGTGSRARAGRRGGTYSSSSRFQEMKFWRGW